MGENRCACCLRPLYLGRGVRCKDCGEKSCRKGCSRFDPSDNAWRCIFCRQQRFLPKIIVNSKQFMQFLILPSCCHFIQLICFAICFRVKYTFLTRERFIDENIVRNWLERHGSEAFGGSISQEDLRLYFNTAKSRVYVAGLFIEYEYFNLRFFYLNLIFLFY